MDAAHMLIAEAVTKLASEMPAAYVEALACALQVGPVSKALAVPDNPDFISNRGNTALSDEHR